MALKIFTLILILKSYIFCQQSKEYHSKQKNNAVKVEKKDTIHVDKIDTLHYVLGKFDPSKHTLFTEIPASHANRSGMYIRREVWDAYKKMIEVAAKENIKFKIISATRNFQSQKQIWEDKWNGKTLVEDGKDLSKTGWSDEKKALKILEYSSMPSTSRHHWGTDMDINALNNAYFDTGEGKKWYDWMKAHAHEYGFCQPYTAGRNQGYKEERWHWTYMPISKPLTEYYKTYVKVNQIEGFIGSAVAGPIDVINNYVLGINQNCK